MADCKECNGKGKILNPEWDKQWDRLSDNYPSAEMIEARLGKMGIPKYIPCKSCDGNK